MCERALKLRAFIDQWLQEEIALKPNGGSRSNSGVNDTSDVDYRDLKRLHLSPGEWRHLELIAKMLVNFKKATSQLSKIDRPQVQHVWQMYNRLFDFLDEMKSNFTEETETEYQWGDKWTDHQKSLAIFGHDSSQSSQNLQW